MVPRYEYRWMTGEESGIIEPATAEQVETGEAFLSVYEVTRTGEFDCPMWIADFIGEEELRKFIRIASPTFSIGPIGSMA